MVNSTKTLLFGFIVALFFVSGCGKGPDKVLKNFLDAEKQGKFAKAYEYLSSSDKKETSKEKYVFGSKLGVFEEFICSNSSYEIKKVDEKEDSAVVIVLYTRPDYRGITEQIFVKGLDVYLDTRESSNDFFSKYLEKYKTEPIPFKTEEEKHHLIKEGDQWKVFFNWKQAREEKERKEAEEKQQEQFRKEQERLRREKEEKLEKLFLEAEKLRDEKKFLNAVEKYKAILKIDNASARAQEGISKIKKERMKVAYIPKVKLYATTARMMETVFNRVVPGVTFKLKNTGNRSLKEVEVTFYFKNSLGRVIAEETYHPVLVSDYSFRDNKPLKPGYIWQLESDQFLKASSVPDEWKEGSYSAKITNIEFAE